MSLEGFQYFIYPFMDFFALMSAVFALLVFFKIRKTSLPFFKQNRWLVRVFVLLALAAMSAAIAEFSWDIIEWVYGSEAEFGLPNLFYVIDSCLLVFAFFYFSISIYKLEKKLGLGLFLNLTSSTILVIMVYFFINKYIFSVYAEESFLSLFLGYFYPMMSSLIFFNTLSIFIFLRRFSFFAWPLLFFALAGIFVFVGDVIYPVYLWHGVYGVLGVIFDTFFTLYYACMCLGFCFLLASLRKRKAINKSFVEKMVPQHHKREVHEPIVGHVKLSTIFVLSFITIAVFFTAVGNYAYYFNNKKVLSNIFENNIQELTDLEAEHISMYLEETKQSLNMISSSMAKNFLISRKQNKSFFFNSPQTKLMFDPYVGDGLPFDALFILDEHGRLLLSAGNDSISDDSSNFDYFVNAKKKDYVTVRISEFTGNKHVVFSTPIFDDGGILLGVLVAYANLSEVDYVTHLNDAALESYLLNEEGYAITNLAYVNDSLLKVKPLSEELFYSKCVNAESVSKFYKNYAGMRVLGKCKAVPSTSWFVVVEVREALILGFVHSMLIFSFVTFVVLALIISIIAYFFSKIVSTPVIRITDEITRITKGEFDVKLGNSSIYEIQKLYDALSRIVVSLKLAVLKVGTKKGLGLGKSLSSEDEMKLKFDVLFEASKDVVLIMGVDGTIRNVNRSVYDLVGYTKDEVEGKKFYDLKLLTPQTKKICIENFRKRLKGEDVPPYRVEFVRKDGKKVIGEITSSKLIMNKELIGFIVIVKEVKSFAS